MSWAEEDWTVGLSGRVLQKVKELQVHQERLSRENRQKQLQLDNLQTSLEKQSVKYEEVRGELLDVQRELQRVRDEAKAAVASRERLTQELQTKQAQACSFEGQLDSARTLNNKLTQEVKRLEAELDKLQSSSRAADTSLYSTPCWNTASPWEHSGSRKEERPGHKDEGPSRALHSRQRLQFSDMATGSLPRQQHKNTPHRHPSDQSDSFSSPLAAFPWERDDSRPAARKRSPPSPQAPCTDVISQVQLEQGVCGKEKDYRAETDISLAALRSRVCALEEELCAKTTTLKSIQNEMVQSKKELAARDLNIQRARDELSLAHTRMAQESERASGAEQRLKQLQEELKCQRQNAESSRLQHQQRSKELEKQHQRDVTELQKERLCLEKQHQQETNKLNQELQQARTLHNALQAQADKLSLQKQALDKELDTLKEKLKWTEGQLQESQNKEVQTQAKLMETLREAEGVAVSLEQSKKKEKALEEEGRRLAEERADALRLLKEMQEQKAAPVPHVQPVQFCPPGQNFSPQPSYSPHSQPSTHMKRPTTAALPSQKREDADKRTTEMTTSYPSHREPGEGINSEHITVVVSPDSECLQMGGGRRQSSEEENNNTNESLESESSGTNKHSTFDHALPVSLHSAADAPTNTSMDDCSSMLSVVKVPSLKSELPTEDSHEDLKRENATLRSELSDAREELQKRLEDLEAQRRAEAEARTRLKQLSRKQSSQSLEKEEQDREWRTQLESEKAETERLRKALAALETEIKRGQESREVNERQEEKNKALEDRESEMIELNIQLKKQLAEVKAQLALEREERKQEEEERNQIINTDIDVKKELSMKLEELEAELEELKRSRKEDSPDEEKHSPLRYLSLHDDELNSNTAFSDSMHLSSPEQHLIFCESTNQRNVLVSQAPADLIQQGRMLIDPGGTPEVDSDLDDTRQNYLVGSSLSEPSKALSDTQKEEPIPLDLAKEVTRLRKENAVETERANQCQIKLEALQSQVTRQTQQLTMAFEKQSQHISGLLGELQEKESALLSQAEELQYYKQELDALKAQKEEEEKGRGEVTVKEDEKVQDRRSVDIPEPQPNLEKECATISLADAQRAQPETATSDATRQTAISDNGALSGRRHPASVASHKTRGNRGSVCVIAEVKCDRDAGAADVAAELLALRQENQQLKQRIVDLSPVLLTEKENQEDPVKQSQNTGDDALACVTEQRSSGEPAGVTAETRQSPLQNVQRNKDAGGDLKREERSTEEELEGVCQLQIEHLQQQVVELHTRIRALSEETQQQAEELAVWRMASQPVPTFALFTTDNQPETQDQISAVTQSQSNQQSQAVSLNVQESPGNVAIIREDELLLTCCSNKLQGRMLFSRLQQSNLPESKSLHPSKKTAALQEYNQNTAMIDKESEKENQEIHLLRQPNSCQTKQKEKMHTEVILMSSEKTCQQHVAKDAHKISGPKPTKTADMANPDAKPDAPRAISELNSTSDSPDRDVRAEMRSVSSQTVESLYPRSAPSAPEHHCVYTQTEQVEEEDDEEDSVESPPVSPIPLPEAAALGDTMLFSGSFPIPADPARLAERIRRNRTQLSAAFDDTEYEPYGLPEVVMKGFADIPSGPSCPYIVRRGLLGTAVVTVPQKNLAQEETD